MKDNGHEDFTTGTAIILTSIKLVAVGPNHAKVVRMQCSAVNGCCLASRLLGVFQSASGMGCGENALA